MFTVSWATLRSVRAVARKGRPGRPRGPAPPVLIVADGNTVRFTLFLAEGIVTCRVPTEDAGPDHLLMPMTVLDAVEGFGNDPVTIERTGPLHAEVRWSDRGAARTLTTELLAPERHHEVPSEPASFAPMPVSFRSALQEAGRTVSRDPSRFALHRVQLRGKTGQVIATDGRFAYLRSGFAFPFAEDLLIPALALFGSPEFAREREVALGRTETHVVVTTGPWTVFLELDKGGRFPDVVGAIPKALTPTTVVLDEQDARTLLDALPRLPGANDANRPVTIDLASGQSVCVRAKGDDSNDHSEIRLDRSEVTNGPVRVAMDRSFLKRAVELGCRMLRVVASDKPVTAVGGDLTVIVMSLDPSVIVTPASVPEPVPHPSPEPERNAPMSEPAELVQTTNERTESADVTDPLVEAEAVRAALGDLTRRAGRLVSVLKQNRKEKKALAHVWAGLRQLTHTTA